MMDSAPVVVTDQDVRRIRRILGVSNDFALGNSVANLMRTLERATQVRSDRLGSAVVTLDSKLSVENLDTGAVEDYTLVLPGDADKHLEGLSVLGPLGCQLLGRRVGDLVRFEPPGSSPRWVRIKRIYSPPRANAWREARRADGSPVAYLVDVTHPEYPVERVCIHLYEPFQLTFARQAQQALPKDEEVQAEASHRGLVLRGETEAALAGCVESLREYFGNQIRVGPPTVRYHRGVSLEEPHMGLRVTCLPEHFEAVRVDLEARGALIVGGEITAAFAVVQATAPLAQLLGYSRSLASMTAGSAHEAMWLSHYAPVETPGPDGDAA